MKKVVLLQLLLMCGLSSMMHAARSNPRQLAGNGMSGFFSEMSRMFDNMDRAFDNMSCAFDDDDYMFDSIDKSFAQMHAGQAGRTQMITKSSSGLGGSLQVDQDGKFTLEFPAGDSKLSASGNVQREVLTNQKFLNVNGGLEIRLCQLKEVADDGERTIIVTAQTMPHDKQMLQISVTFNSTLRTESGDSSGLRQSVQSSSICNQWRHTVQVPEGFVADVASVEMLPNGLTAQLLRANTVPLVSQTDAACLDAVNEIEQDDPVLTE